MKLTVTYRDKMFEVDNTKRPGSPPVGRGRTFKEALGDYVYNNQGAMNITFELDTAAEEKHFEERKKELRKR